jgi:hypothetical protein
MRRWYLSLFVIAAAAMLGDHPMSAQQDRADPCPLNLRRGIPDVAREREAKKQRMRDNGVPERYLHLLDKEECIECIKTAPDTVHVTIVWKDEFAPRLVDGRVDHVTEERLLPQIERQLRDDLIGGKIESFRVWLSNYRCRCCPEPEDQTYQDDPGWDDDLGLDTDQADTFDDPGDLPPLPDDLKNAPAGWVPPPPIENFPPPHGRYMHVICPACQGLADQWNQQARNMDMLQERKNSLLRSISVMRNAIGNRNNEINDLEYQQQFNSSRSYDRMKQIEQLKQYNDAHESQIEKAFRDITAVEQQMAEVQAKLDELMQKVLECEKACKKTTALSTPERTVTISLEPKKPGLYYELPPELPTLGLLPPPINISSKIANADPPPTTAGPSSPPIADRSETVPVANWRDADPDLRAACEKCEPKAKVLRDLNQQLSSLHARVESIRAQRAVLQHALAMGRGNPQEMQGQLNQLSQNEGNALAEYQSTIADIARAERELEECNKTMCAPATADQQPPSPQDPVMAPPDEEPISLDPAFFVAKCEKCQPIVKQILDAIDQLSRLQQQWDDAVTHVDIVNAETRRDAREIEVMKQRFAATGDPAFEARLKALRSHQVEATQAVTNELDSLHRRARVLIAEINGLSAKLDACNKEICSTATTADTPNTCIGSECGATWRECSANNSCTPIDQDCGVPGTLGCPYADPPGVQAVNLNDPQAWGSVMTISVTLTLDQSKGVHPASSDLTSTPAAMMFPAMQPEPIHSWFNPLGLLASRIGDQVDRWRGSVGPRPFITTGDLKLIDSVSNAQAAGLPQGVHMLLTDRGGSTGKTLGLQVLNFSGKPVRLSSIPFAIEPLDRKASQAAQLAFARLAKVMPQHIDLSAYCLDFLKAPPSANTIYRLAPKAVQDKFAPISKVLRSAYRIEHAGLLNPDSTASAYTDSIKQWAVWAVEQRLNETRFTDAFMGHTKKNVEGAGQKWSKDAEAVIRKISPNRWNDITKILRGAGLPLPQ